VELLDIKYLPLVDAPISSAPISADGGVQVAAPTAKGKLSAIEKKQIGREYLWQFKLSKDTDKVYWLWIAALMRQTNGAITIADVKSLWESNYLSYAFFDNVNTWADVEPIIQKVVSMVAAKFKPKKNADIPKANHYCNFYAFKELVSTVFTDAKIEELNKEHSKTLNRLKVTAEDFNLFVVFATRRIRGTDKFALENPGSVGQVGRIMTQNWFASTKIRKCNNAKYAVLIQACIANQIFDIECDYSHNHKVRTLRLGSGHPQYKAVASEKGIGENKE